MKRPLRATAASLLATGFVLAAGTASIAATYDFPETCDAGDIEQSTRECTSSIVTINIDADGTTRWARETAYPRDAFDTFLFEVEGNLTTTESYLESAAAEYNVEDGVEFSSSLTDDYVAVTFTLTHTQESGDAQATGVSLLDDQLTVDIEPVHVSQVDHVTISFPGTVTETNGVADGASVTWNQALLDSGETLTLVGTVSEPLSSERWIIAGVALGVCGALAGIYFVFLRRRRGGVREPINLSPEFES